MTCARFKGDRRRQALVEFGNEDEEFATNEASGLLDGVAARPFLEDCVTGASSLRYQEGIELGAGPVSPRGAVP
jgi:hypothetical protein